MPPKKASKRSSDGDDDVRIRNHANRAGESDNENEYEHVKKGDDESIDDDASEVGWNSDDEHAFHKTTVYRNKKSSRRQDPESEDDIDDDELLQNGGVLLSDLLFQNMSGDKNAKKSIKDESSDSEEDDESEDDEDENEEGSEMQEESENDSNSASDSEEHPSSDEGDEDLDDVHNRLLSAIDRFSKPQETSEKSQAGKRHNHQNSAESAYSSLIDNGDVSMNALLGALDDTRGLSVVKKHLADLEKGLAAPVHVEKVVADRMERTQVYSGAQEDMNKWHATVASNRHATTLDLAKDKRQVRSFKSMVNRFVPTTDMEKEIQMVLVKHGATDESNEQNEIDELQGRNLTLQEIREKQAELAKVKALMFYDQMKRHRMNKIKSKAYRKIQKKKKLKSNDLNNNDLDEEEQENIREKDAFKRVKERMDMRHKNTSKWAKKALQYGHTDKSLRDAYHESVQLGHDLTQKMNEELQDDSRSVDSASEGEQEGGGSGDEEKLTGASARRAVSNRASRAIESLLAENLGSNKSADRAAVSDGRYKKLFEMDFMKRAAEQQKEKAREDAQSILREIEAMEEDYDSDLQADEATEAAKKKGPQVSKERLSQAKEEIQSMFGGSGMAMRQGRRKGITVQASSSSTPFEFASTGGDDEDEKPEYSDEEEHAAMEAALETNPWLQPVASVSGSKKRKSTGTGAKAGKDQEEVMINTLEIQAASNGKKNKNTTNTTQPATSSSSNNKKKNNKKNGQQPTTAASVEEVSGVVVETKDDSASNAKKEKAAVKISLSEGQTQADLVQMAFAGPDLEAEFHAYKKGEVDAELGLDEKKMKIISDVKAGWGDWAGPGAGGMQISQKVLNKRDQLITKVQKEHDLKVINRKDSKMMNVMLSGRRIKTSSKYKISEIPHPYTSIEEYERSLQMPLGEEWNSTDVVKNYTQPEIKLRPGRVIEPIKLSKKRNNSSTATAETRLNKPNKKAKK